MERFIHRENIRRYRDLLREAKSEAERQRIQILLDEEIDKGEPEAGGGRAGRANDFLKAAGEGLLRCR